MTRTSALLAALLLASPALSNPPATTLPAGPVSLDAFKGWGAVSEDRAIHIATVFRYNPEKDEMAAQPGGGISSDLSEEEAVFAGAWAESIWSDTFL